MAQEKTILLASPRGFCAGVQRAINLVENALLQYGTPIYVRHEIVHNKHVIENLKQKGAVFVESIDEIPPHSVVIFSAHGVGKDVEAAAKEKGLAIIDATCPLVEKVHRQIQQYATQNMEIIVIGKASHPEIIGTLGQIPEYKKIHIVQNKDDIEKISIATDTSVGFVTQTTLSVDDTAELITLLKEKFPQIKGLQTKDICYATTNRQKAVKQSSIGCDVFLVIGSKNSSNSKQLKEVALKSGAKEAFLIDDASEIDWQKIDFCKTIGISAGASAPEHLVTELIKNFQSRYHKINIRNVIIAEEKVNFKF